jgi:hypothetical protein
MRAATVEDVAQEFMRIRAEGWDPDPEEFLHRVPEDVREECRARLEELIGEVNGQAAAEPEQEHEPEQASEGFGDDEMIVFELDNDGPIRTVRVPSVDTTEAEVEEIDEPEEMDVVVGEDRAAEFLEPIAAETALEPEVEEAEAVEVEEAEFYEQEVVEPELVEANVAEPEVEQPETAELEEAVTAEIPEAAATEPEVAAIEEAETVEVPEPQAVEPEVVEPDVAEAETAEIAEPIALAEPEPQTLAKPQGLVKLSREEAKAMFEAMERARG